MDTASHPITETELARYFAADFSGNLESIAYRDLAGEEVDDDGVRGDRREDLECILNRDVSSDELDAFIEYGSIPIE